MMKEIEIITNIELSPYQNDSLKGKCKNCYYHNDGWCDRTDELIIFSTVEEIANCKDFKEKLGKQISDIELKIQMLKDEINNLTLEKEKLEKKRIANLKCATCDFRECDECVLYGGFKLANVSDLEIELCETYSQK